MSQLHPTSPIATVAARRRRIGAAATIATLALGSALAGSAATDAAAAPDSHAEPAEPSFAITLSVHGEDRRAWRPDGDARLERVRTVRFSWRSR